MKGKTMTLALSVRDANGKWHHQRKRVKVAEVRKKDVAAATGKGKRKAA